MRNGGLFTINSTRGASFGSLEPDSGCFRLLPLLSCRVRFRKGFCGFAATIPSIFQQIAWAEGGGGGSPWDAKGLGGRKRSGTSGVGSMLPSERESFTFPRRESWCVHAVCVAMGESYASPSGECSPGLRSGLGSTLLGVRCTFFAACRENIPVGFSVVPPPPLRTACPSSRKGLARCTCCCPQVLVSVRASEFACMSQNLAA